LMFTLQNYENYLLKLIVLR